MGTTLEAGKSRFVSDTVMLDVTAIVPAEMLHGYLVPDTRWETKTL